MAERSNPLVLSHYTLASCLGRGLAATYEALRGRRSGLAPCDFEDAALKTWIGRVAGLEDRPLPGRWRRFDCRNNRLALAALKQDGFAEAVEAARARYGAGRVAVLIGTSTSGILETEHAYRRRDPEGALPAAYIERYPYCHNTYSVAGLVRAYLGLTGPAAVISTACSSSAKVFASASRLLSAGLCDAAVVGGVDSLCLTVLYGFAALELTASGPCRPCDAERDGLSIGEAAGFALLERPATAGAGGAVALLGYGESGDGYHMSHPHPEGLGAIEAMREALARAGLEAGDIDYINLHGTGTRANDLIEDRAITTVFGRDTPCSSTKGYTGHTLGAAGIVEAVIGALCLSHGLIPGTLNTRRVDPLLTSAIRLANEERPITRLLSNIFGFGGNNCSLVFGRLPPR
jgi:3-oxoacyl-[acyl-carrier-protein] synthase-1